MPKTDNCVAKLCKTYNKAKYNYLKFAKVYGLGIIFMKISSVSVLFVFFYFAVYKSLATPVYFRFISMPSTTD